jgi:hypothetical protein
MASSATMEYLGVTLNFTFDPLAPQDQRYTMEIPAIGFAKTPYGGASRDDALKKMKADIKLNFGEIQSALVSSTPNSIVAGNPASLQSQMVSGQFDVGFSSMSSVLGRPSPTGSSSVSSGNSASTSAGDAESGGNSSQDGPSALRGIGLRFGRYSFNGLRSQSATIPRSYVWRFDEDDERRSITFSLPLTGGKVEDSKTYSAQAGLGIGVPINTVWTLTPALGYGIAGSGDLLQATQQVSISLTSAYAIPLDDGYLLSVGNMLGYYSTVKLQIKDYQSGGDVQNTILRNGLLLAIPLPASSFLGEGLALELSGIQTKFFGSKLFTGTMSEAGFTIGTDKRAQGLKTYLRADVSFIVAKDFNGITANFGYWF